MPTLATDMFSSSALASVLSLMSRFSAIETGVVERGYAGEIYSDLPNDESGCYAFEGMDGHSISPGPQASDPAC